MNNSRTSIPKVIRGRRVLETPERDEDAFLPDTSAQYTGDQEKLQNVKDRESDRKLRKYYASKAFKFAYWGFVFWVTTIYTHIAILFFYEKKVLSDKYSMVYIVDDVCVLRYDNERGKSDHRHWGATESVYAFTTLEQLLADFYADIERWNDEHKPF
jgi:hypothetical protein